MNWQRAVVVWLLIAVAESVHGTLRRLFLVPRIGELLSHQIGVVVGSAIIFTIAWLCIRWIGAGSYRQQLQVGALWVVLTLIFEFSLGYFLGYSWNRVLSDYDLSKGGLMVFGVLFMLFAPELAARARGLSGKDGER
ncbi:MAG: hypothetical protein FDX18_09240 [Chlorobium sp.]|nr:MAG: hypothetical protein FDX18_09240 [Chlorobium sp.]